jgi:phosphatidylglycerol:prolipoprotein diacylglycerol transferase
MSHAFPAALVLGFLSALAWIGLSIDEGKAPSRQLAEAANWRLDGFLVAAFCALLVARAAFVALHWGYFGDRPLDAFKLWEGGLAGWAAGFGALAGLWSYGMVARVPWRALADELAIPGTLVVFTAWVGCMLDGCAYGRSVAGSWWTPLTPDLLGQRRPRFPTQSMGALASAGWLFALHRWQHAGWPEGTVGMVAVGGHGTVALLLASLRADPVPYLAGVRSDLLGAAALILSAGALLVTSFLGKRKATTS